MHFLFNLLIISFVVVIETAFVYGHNQTSDEICHCHDSILNRMIIKKSRLLVYDASGIISIHAKAKWKKPKIVFGTVVVDSGAELTISGKGAIVQFADSKHSKQITRIIVKPGGKLVITNRAKLTALLHCPHTMWDGIELIGNPGLNQTSQNQALLDLLDCRIEDARIAILAGKSERGKDGDIVATAQKGGAIIYTDNINKPLLFNCRFGIWMSPYKFYNNSILSGIEFIGYQLRDRSYINPDLTTARIKSMERGIFLNSIGFINIFSNRFAGEISLDNDLRGIGIRAVNSGFHAYNNTFTNLAAGIDARYPSGGTAFNTTIDYNTFEYVWQSIYLRASSFAELSGNVFNYIPASSGLAQYKIPYGVWMHNSNAFSVTNNDFTGLDPFDNYGIIITNSRQLGGEVFNNRFSNLNIGTQTERWNGHLILRCNEYDADHNRAWLICPQLPGSLANQGNNCNATNPMFKRAGNLFFQPQCSTACSDEWHITSPFVEFKYYAHGDPLETYPSCATELTLCNSNWRDITPCSNSGSDIYSCLPIRICSPPCIEELMADITAEPDSVYKQHIINRLIHYRAITDTLTADTIMINYLDSTITDDGQWTKVAIYLARQRADTAMTIMENIQLNNYNDSAYFCFYNILINLALDEQQLEDMNSESREIMATIADDTLAVSLYAATLLELINGTSYYYEPEQLQGEGRLTFQGNANSKSRVPSIIALLKLSPNPASNEVTITYRLDSEDAEAHITLTDLQGRQLLLLKKQEQSGNFVLSTETITPGIYYCSLYAGKELKIVNKLVIQQ